MKRKISYLLSLVMLLSMFSSHPILAADTIELDYVKDMNGNPVRLVETQQQGLMETPISKDAEEATMRWSIAGRSGKYELTYYSDSIQDNPNDTTKVVLGFDVGKNKDGATAPNKIQVKAELFKSNNAPINFTSYQYISPYTGAYSTPTTGSNYTTELTIPVVPTESVPIGAREVSLQLGTNLKIRAISDGTTIRVWTNQINKGYVTDFELKYLNMVQDTQVVFPGISNAKILSVYMENSLEDRIKPINATNGEQAGDRPGIKVEFDRPLVRTGNKFEIMTDTQAQNISVALNLYTKLEVNDIGNTNKIQLNFKLAESNIQSTVIPSGVTKKAKYNSATNKMAVYVAKSKTYVSLADDLLYLVEWPALEESMVIGGELTLNGSVKINGGGKQHSISTSNVALPTGYTYLRFTPEQSDVGEVTLQIAPYKYKGEIIYQVFAANATSPDLPGAITPNSLLGEYRFTYDPTYPDRKLEVSVPSGVETIFLVRANLSNDASDAASQEVYYNSQDPNIVIKPYTPQIREVNSVYVIPEGETGVEAAGIGLVWSAPERAKLEQALAGGKKMYFELSLYNHVKANKALIAVFKAEVTTGSGIHIEQVGRSLGTVKYDPDKNQFIASNIMLKELEKTHWEKISLPANYERDTSYPVINDSSYTQDMSYTIPNSFYLSIRTLLDSGTTLKTSANESQLYPLTLDKTTEVVPAPTRVEATKYPNTTNVGLVFNNVDIKPFVNKMLNPGYWYLLGSNQNSTLPGQYEICLYQANYLEGSTTINNDMSESTLSNYIKEENGKIFSWPTAVATTPAAIDFTGQQDALSALRSGKVVKITMNNNQLIGGENNLAINGLDPNQSYYVRIRVKLDSQRSKGGVTETRTDYSLFSKIYGFTSSTVAKPIEPDEEVPSTPKDFKAEAVDNSTAKLTWNDPEIVLTASDTVTYEIIRTKEQKISDNLLKRTNRASDIVSQESAKAATLFGSSDYVILDTDNGKVYQLIDKTLQPNTVYYYYIRTVYKNTYSEWIYQPVTTMNIDAPISLKAFNATKTTVDISFLAKVPSSGLYGTYDFGVAIQSEENPNWSTTLASSLSKLSGASAEQVPDGYNYYSYKITGLTPGKRYNIKVCVMDKTKEMIDGKYQQSLYSNSVYVRTEYDQAEQDKEDKYKEYIDRFDKEVEKFRNHSYWTVEDETTYKYRADYLEADMGLNNEYTLVTGKNSKESNYYFPIGVLFKMNEEKVTFKVAIGNETVYIRPDTIKNSDELFSEANDLMDANKLEDYYLKVTVATSNFSGTINDEEVISPKISLDMTIVYMRQEDHLTEADILEALEEIIKAKRETFISRLEIKLESGKLDKDTLQGILDDVLGDVETQHMKKVSKIMDKQIKSDLSINEISKAILIVHNGDHANVNGYYYLNNWTAVEVLPIGNGFAIEATKLGTYIFTGAKPLIDTIPEVAPYQNLINQYGLGEFFKMDSYMLQVAVSKQQVYGALARMMGASKGSDYMTYLQNKGVKGISKLTFNNTIRQDEAIYIIMQGYEVIQHKNVNAIAIKNRQGVQNIGAFQTVYRPYVYAAVELKIIQPVNNMVMPSKQMTGKEIIEMLYRIQ